MLFTKQNTVEKLYFYKIRQRDTIYSIATNLLGSADKFNLIVLYNNLEPPYIVSETTEREIKATGQGIFSRIVSGTEITIPVGTIVYAEPDEFTPYIREYQTTETITIPVNENSTNLIDIVATQPGEKFNILENKITKIRGDLANYLTFTNPLPILNGKILKVKKPGEYLVIPANIITNFNIKELQPADDYYNDSILGVDLSLFDGDLTPNKDYNIESAELNTVSGVDNVIQALTHKLITYKGSLLGHPEYGSLLPYLIGNFSGDYLAEMVRVETARTLLTDPRVAEVKYVTVDQVNNAIYIDYGVQLIGMNETIGDNLVFPIKK